jgi:ankyrin repeat protein
MAFQTVEVLLKYEADPHILNKDGWTALHIGCRTGHYGVVARLLEKFPDLVNMLSTNGRYPLHAACKFCTVYFSRIP